MARIRLSESIEIGNYKTGYYRRYSREAEIEGTAQEVSLIVSNISRTMRLPGLSRYGDDSDISILKGMPHLLQLED